MLDEHIARTLAITPQSSATARTIDITTTGARTGRSRRIEIFFYRADGEIYLTTPPPATRSWYANLLANPAFTFHLKNGVRADLAAEGEPVLNRGERHRIFSRIIDDLNGPVHRAYLAQPVPPVEDWIDGSPLMHVTFPGAPDGAHQPGAGVPPLP